MPPHKTKRRTTTNLKTKINQNFQKVELYGSLTTKELKKKHLSRPVGGAETGSGRRGLTVRQQLADLARQRIVEWAVPHSRADKSEEQLGSKTDCTTQGSSEGKIKPQTTD